MTPMLEFLPEKRATAREMLSHPWLDGPPPPTPTLPNSVSSHPDQAAHEGARGHQGGGEEMLVEEREEEDLAVNHAADEAGRGEEGEGAEDALAEAKEVIEEAIEDANEVEVEGGGEGEGKKEGSAEPLIPPEDSGLIGDSPTKGEGSAVTMMEV